VIAGISVYAWFCIWVTFVVVLLCIAAAVQAITDPQPRRER
jgi:hypothetical protein